MAFHNGGNIVTDGLVLALDASSPRSYAGSGTTWYDLSGNEYDATLNDSAIGTVSSSFKTMYFNGGSQGIYLSSNTAFDINQSGMTFNIWVNQTNKNVAENSRLLYRYQDANNSYQLVVPGANSSVFTWGIKDSGILYQGGFSGTTSQNQIYNLCLVYESGSTTGYVNGIVISPAAGISPGDTTADTQLHIGRRINNSEFTGNVYCYHQYNRALSVAEILQNYNATKGRFL